MRTAQASFVAAIPKDAEYDHPPGANLARRLHRALSTAFPEIEEFDNWRDCGWEIRLRSGRVWASVPFAQVSRTGPEWLLAVVPEPSIEARVRAMLGHEEHSRLVVVRRIRSVVHEVLVDVAAGDVLWFFGTPNGRGVRSPEMLDEV